MMCCRLVKRYSVKLDGHNTGEPQIKVANNSDMSINSPSELQTWDYSNLLPRSADGYNSTTQCLVVAKQTHNVSGSESLSRTYTLASRLDDSLTWNAAGPSCIGWHHYPAA